AQVLQVQTATSSFALSLGFFVATLGLLLAFRYRWLRGQALPLLALAIILVDLVGNNAIINPTPDDPTGGFNHPPVTDFLDRNLTSQRLDTVTGVEDVWQPDAAALYRYRSLWGLYDPLTLVDYYWYWKIHVPGRGSRLYDLLGARYVLGHKDVVLDKPKFQLAFDGDSQINVYENASALPRAFFVGQAIPVPDHDAALAAIKTVGFDPGRAVVVEDFPPGLSTGTSHDSFIPVSFGADGANSVSIKVDAPTNGFIVLADPYYPGWTATVDGQPAPLLRGDWVFRTVPVPAGSHQVTFAFRPRSVVIGGVISAIAWLAALGLIGVSVFRGPSRTSVAQ
ncbi:MAG TPA: YfhO family protein, partial [Chloroflexota bacterium]|nr:YfhO family protein [Chloroflexota bacterium]